MDDLQTILAIKQHLLEQRQQRTPLLALISLVDMRARPLPSLDVVHDAERIMTIGYVPLVDIYDPVLHALRMARAGVDAVALFTDNRVYSKGLNDLLMVSLGMKNTPVIAFNYPLSEYHVLELRASGASAVVLYAGLVPLPMLKRMTSIALRARMTVIIHAQTTDEFDVACTISPHAISIGVGEYFDFDANHAMLDYAHRHKPYNMRLLLRPCLTTLAQVEQVVNFNIDAVVLDEVLLKDHLREKVYALLQPR